MADNMSGPPSNDWVVEGLAAFAMLLGVVGAWFRDRLLISNRMAKIEGELFGVNSKLDLLLTIHTPERPDHGQRRDQ